MVAAARKITTKRQMYDLYLGGRLGNIVQNWNSIEEALESGFPGRMAIRYREAGSPWCVYHIEPSNLESEAKRLEGLGANRALFNVSEMMPDDKLVIQGEVMRGIRGLSLFYSVAHKPMRVALAASGQQVYGVVALEILKNSLDPASLDDLQGHLEDFPDAVVEFSTYSVSVGRIPHRNTVFWEVRNY